MSERLKSILEQIQSLDPGEQTLLYAHVLTHRQKAWRWPGEKQPRWSSLVGLATEPLAGEDAQAWVSRSRERDEQAREGAA